MNKKRRVLVVENQRLLGAGIQRLLMQEADLEVAGVTPADEAALVEEIRRFGPDWVILDEATASADMLCGLFPDGMELRVAVLRADDALVQIYEKRRIKSASAADLMALFRS